MIDAGALGLKAFLSPSGIDDFGNVSIAHVTGALPTLMALGVPLYVHAELVTEPPEPEVRKPCPSGSRLTLNHARARRAHERARRAPARQLLGAPLAAPWRAAAAASSAPKRHRGSRRPPNRLP